VLTAAYLAGMSAGTDVDALSEVDLQRELLSEHEARYWEQWNQRRGLGLDVEDQSAAVALATLLTAHGEAEALAVTRLVPHHGGEPEPRLIAIARWLAQLYPPAAAAGQLILSPLEPDRLGEVLVGDVLRGHEGLLAAACDAASDRQLTQALTVTSRIAQADQTIRDQLRAVLDQHLGDFLGRALAIDDDEILAAVTSAMTISRPTDGALDAANRFPEALPVWLRPLAADITALAVGGLRARADNDPAVTADLARMLSNLGVSLAAAGRREEALAAAQEAVGIYRELAGASPAAYLPDLATSLSNLGNRLAEAGRAEEAEELLHEVLVSFEHDPLGTGHILRVRGDWLRSQHRLSEVIADLVAAVNAFTQARDRRMRGEVRQLLCWLRRGDQSAFDSVWDQEADPQPIWLQYPDTDEELTDTVIAWVRTPDWQASRAYLDEQADALLADRGEAALEHLIDHNPASADLRDHLDLLQAARADGPDAAYAAHSDRVLTDRLTQILNDWINTRTWEQSEAFAAAHVEDLLRPAAPDILDDAANRDLGDRVLRLHRGLLGCAAVAGFNTAYTLRADPGQRQAAFAQSDLAADARLAVARLHSGQSADDPDAHFRLASAALLAGDPEEAAAALADCADNAAPYERRDFARRLREVTAGQPQLAVIVAELEQTLLATPDSQASAESDDTTADDPLHELMLAWIGTATWEDSEAFLTSHSKELLTRRGYAALTRLAAGSPGDNTLAMHRRLLSAVLAKGIAVAYAQLQDELAQARRSEVLGEWLGLAADPTASAAYLAEHADDLNHPRAIALLAAECDRDPANPLLWRHLGLLLLADQSADGYATARIGDPGPFQRAVDLIDDGDLDRALAWACLARAADLGPGALLMGRIQTRRDDPIRAREALATAAEQIGTGQLVEVLDAYDLLIAAQPEDPWLLNDHANALQRAGRDDGALAAYDRALGLAPDEPSPHFNRPSCCSAWPGSRKHRKDCSPSPGCGPPTYWVQPCCSRPLPGQPIPTRHDSTWKERWPRRASGSLRSPGRSTAPSRSPAWAGPKTPSASCRPRPPHGSNTRPSSTTPTRLCSTGSVTRPCRAWNRSCGSSAWRPDGKHLTWKEHHRSFWINVL